MFLTITPLPRQRPRNLIQRIQRAVMDKINPPATQVRRVEVLESAFLDVRVFAPGEEFPENWAHGTRLGCRMALCPPGWDLPAGCLRAVTAEQVRSFLARVLCNTAVELLRSSGLTLHDRCAGLVDPDCSHPNLLEPLIRHLPEVLVYTKNLTLYQGYADEILEEYGAPITFVETTDALRRAAVVLNTGTEPVRGLFPVPVLSICPGNEGGDGLLIERPVYALAPVEASLPPGIDRDEFYTALFFHCQLEALGRLCAQEAQCSGRRVTLGDITAQIQRNRSI